MKKSSKKRIYRPSEYIHAYAICVITSIVCLAITLPVLSGAAKYWGVQRSIEDVRMEAAQHVWTDARTAESKVYEAEREELAKENVVVNWCWKNNDTWFSASIRNTIIGICIIVFLYGCGMSIFTVYCIGRDARYGVTTYLFPIIGDAWKNANAFTKGKREEKRLSKAEEMRKKVYKQFGIEAN